ncbi:hypothetical protein FA13DRAFT_1722489 [Coprinellus micaceus]|uniref:Uncharacterized protein n=1 Tax=Coprinellus micaceus TaxID=71717 RepID=A0A4Y7RKX9_COPMI|nr:hypothetical protein FA13DRAFT_1722489 [Coprinellus micaceus]
MGTKRGSGFWTKFLALFLPPPPKRCSCKCRAYRRIKWSKLNVMRHVRPISPQILRKAEEGDLDALRNLGRFLRPKHLTADTLRIAFKHLTTHTAPVVSKRNRLGHAAMAAHGRAKLAYEALKTRSSSAITHPAACLGRRQKATPVNAKGAPQSSTAQKIANDKIGLSNIATSALRRETSIGKEEEQILGYDARDTLPVFDFTQVDALEKRSHTETYPDQEQCWNGSFGQTYLKDRLWTVVTTFRSGSVPAGWRLVQGIFPPLGKDQSIELLVLLKPVGAGYRTAYCMARQPGRLVHSRTEVSRVDRDGGASLGLIYVGNGGAASEGWLVQRTRELRRRGVVGVRDDGALTGRSGWCRGRGSCVGGVVLAGDKGAPSERGWMRENHRRGVIGVWDKVALLEGCRRAHFYVKDRGALLEGCRRLGFYVNKKGALSEGCRRLDFYVNDMGAPSEGWRRLHFYVNDMGDPSEGWGRLDFYVNDRGALLEG